MDSDYSDFELELLEASDGDENNFLEIQNRLRKKTDSPDRMWLLVSDGHDLESCRSLMLNYSHMYSLKGKGTGAKVSKCSVHEDCLALRRMQLCEDGNSYEIHESGAHNEAKYANPKIGLNELLYPLVDPLLEAGQKPQKVAVRLHKMLDVGGSNPNKGLLDALPLKLVNKLRARAAALKNGDPKIESVRELEDFLKPKKIDVCSLSRDDAQKALADFRLSNTEDDLLVLHTFDVFVLKSSVVEGATLHEDGDDNEYTRTQGCVFTSSALLKNIQIAIRDCAAFGLTAAMDGTYKLLFNGWVLIVLSTHTVNYVTLTCDDTPRTGRDTHSAVPLLFSFVRTECQASFDHVLETLKNVSAVVVAVWACMLFFLTSLMPLQTAAKLFPSALDVKVASACMDHSAPTKNAFVEAFPGVRVVDCWAHVVRKAREKAQSLHCVDYFERIMEPQLQQMNKVGYRPAMHKLAKCAVRQWRTAGHTAYAKWFTDVYLHEDWDGWYCAASGVPGASETNNPLESFNAEIKQQVSEKSTMTHFLCKSLPALLLHCRLKRMPSRICRDVLHNQYHKIKNDPVDRGVIDKAKRFLECGSHNWRRVVVSHARANTTQMVYYVNSGSYMGVPVEERFRAFHNIPEDDGVDTMTFEEATLQYGSLHRVVIIRHPDEEHAYYKCDCKHFYRTGYLCAHVFLCCCLDKVVDITEFLNDLEPVKGKGRPSKRTKNLQLEDAAQKAGSNAKKFKKSINMIGAYVRGVGRFANCRTGFVKNTRTSKEEKNVVWYVVAFPEAEGGPRTVDDMTTEEVVLCYNEQLRYAKLARSTHV